MWKTAFVTVCHRAGRIQCECCSLTHRWRTHGTPCHDGTWMEIINCEHSTYSLNNPLAVLKWRRIWKNLWQNNQWLTCYRRSSWPRESPVHSRNSAHISDWSPYTPQLSEIHQQCCLIIKVILNSAPSSSSSEQFRSWDTKSSSSRNEEMAAHGDVKGNSHTQLTLSRRYTVKQFHLAIQFNMINIWLWTQSHLKTVAVSCVCVCVSVCFLYFLSFSRKI